MLKYENQCCDCPIGCIDCGRKRVPVRYCDHCGEPDTLYYFDDEELCIECIKDRLDEVGEEY